MRSLNSGLFYIKQNSFEECDWHITRLSLNFNFDGNQIYFAGNREYQVSPDRFLLINEGQRFKTVAESSTEQRMVTLAFKVGLANEIFRTLTTSQEKLLENNQNVHSLQFFEKTYAVDSFLQSTILSMIKPSSTGDNEYLNEQLEGVLTHVLTIQKNIYRDVMAIKKVKAATRIEIYKRLQWAMEYIHNHYRENISVDLLASHACLSTFHFKRLFKEVFREAPYQYIRKLRIQKAGELLLKDWPVGDVCKAVGWEDSSSFIRLFRRVMNTTPNQYRRVTAEALRRGENSIIAF